MESVSGSPSVSPSVSPPDSPRFPLKDKPEQKNTSTTTVCRRIREGAKEVVGHPLTLLIGLPAGGFSAPTLLTPVMMRCVTLKAFGMTPMLLAGAGVTLGAGLLISNYFLRRADTSQPKEAVSDRGDDSIEDVEVVVLDEGTGLVKSNKACPSRQDLLDLCKKPIIIMSGSGVLLGVSLYAALLRTMLDGSGCNLTRLIPVMITGIILSVVFLALFSAGAVLWIMDKRPLVSDESNELNPRDTNKPDPDDTVEFRPERDSSKLSRRPPVAGLGAATYQPQFADSKVIDEYPPPPQTFVSLWGKPSGSPEPLNKRKRQKPTEFSPIVLQLDVPKMDTPQNPASQTS